MNNYKAISYSCLAAFFLSSSALAEKTNAPKAPVIPSNTQLKKIAPPSQTIQSLSAVAQKRDIALPVTKQAAPAPKLPTNSIKRDTVKLPTGKKPAVSFSVPKSTGGKTRVIIPSERAIKPGAIPTKAIGKKGTPAINANSRKIIPPSNTANIPRHPTAVVLPGHTLPGFDTGKASSAGTKGAGSQLSGKTGPTGAAAFAKGTPLSSRPGGSQITGFGIDGETTVLTGGSSKGAVPTLGEQGPQLNAKGRSQAEGWASQGTTTREYNEEIGLDGFVYEANDGTGSSSYTSTEDALLMQDAVNSDSEEANRDLGEAAANDANDAAEDTAIEALIRAPYSEDDGGTEETEEVTFTVEETGQEEEEPSTAASIGEAIGGWVADNLSSDEEEKEEEPEPEPEDSGDSGYQAGDFETQGAPKGGMVKKGDSISLVDDTLVRTGPDGQGGGFQPGGKSTKLGDETIINPKRDGGLDLSGGTRIPNDSASGANVSTPNPLIEGGFEPGDRLPQQGPEGGRTGGL